jgi:hypothetical protein
MSRRGPSLTELYGLALESQRLNPSWCRVVMTMYFMPAFFASAAHSRGAPGFGANVAASFSYSGMGMFSVVITHSLHPSWA